MPFPHPLRRATRLGWILIFAFTGLWGNPLWSQEWQSAREEMVRVQLENRGIQDPAVLQTMREVPRHLFVPKELEFVAYSDRPLPIGLGQTISQPYVVALMTELLDLRPEMKVLEIGTGSAYQAAVLATLNMEVYSIEIIPELARRATARLQSLQFPVSVKNADGYYGWSEHAPFDRIIITAAANHVPRPLLNQLKPGGKLVLPLGPTLFYQTLTIVTVDEDGQTSVEYSIDVRFVPMTGKVRE